MRTYIDECDRNCGDFHRVRARTEKLTLSHIVKLIAKRGCALRLESLRRRRRRLGNAREIFALLSLLVVASAEKIALLAQVQTINGCVRTR